ncbi:hypothetical protein [Pseudomonas vancouverensis]|uniref:Uncharacterized protein n=1 Tax=Pseudomonas vancouverensis TaxID=95300 RepID=A0A1H2P9Q2_PSEVA|nr:hypothetical protein [Pseudomonas vancouverensis]KAB0490169.1 hypothetical protein F7R09_28125 [Pseudomonas vancouverensis]TDB58727.1 hypothetical protein EIY72_20700 [Pseudomonas vancouverensis]SDV14433.1 hypothetical protein SAMN05216558_4435 [Pseudomonas vancouverensis]
MNRMKRLAYSVFTTTLLITAMAHADGQKVTALLDDTISTYVQKDDYFVREQKIASNALILPAPVLAESARGYVKVSQPGKEIWLDMMDVTLRPPKSTGAAGCIRTSADSSAKTGRGAGEPCQ